MQISVRVAWWFWVWMHALIFFCLLMDREPDWNKVQAMISKAIKLKVDPA